MQHCNKAIQEAIIFVYITKENVKENFEDWPQIPDHWYRILIIWGSRSGKTNDLYNIIDKVYLYAKDPYKVKYQFLINKRKAVD